MALKIQLLGSFQVWRNGKLVSPTEWRTSHAQNLFKLLVTEPGRSYSTDELIELFWPKTEPQKAVLNLRNRISEVRKVLEPELKDRRKCTCILTQHSHYSFNPQADFYLDIQNFVSAHEKAKDMEKLGRFREAIREYERALKFYKGDFLEEDRYEDWTIPYREHYRQVFEDIMLRLADCHARLGQSKEAVELSKKLLTFRPHDEEVYRQLMLYYYLSGNHGQAMEAFQNCQKALAKIGATPSELTEQIRIQLQRKPASDAAAKLPFVTTLLPYLIGPRALLHKAELEHSLEHILYLAEKEVSAFHNEEAIRLGELGIDIINRLEEIDGKAAFARQRFSLISHQAIAYDTLGKREEQKRCIEELFKLAEQANDTSLQAEANLRQSRYFLATGSFEEAFDGAKKSSELYQKTSNKKGEADALGNMGLASHRMGKFQEALKYHDEALKIREEIGDKAGAAKSLNNKGIVLQDMAEYEKALKFYQKAAKLYSEIGDFQGLGNTQLNSGVTFKRIGKYGQAIEQFQQAQANFESIGDEEGIAYALNNIGSLYKRVGYFSEALVHSEQALTIRERLGAKREQALTINDIGLIYLDLGKVDEAVKRFRAAHTLAKRAGDRHLEAIAIANFGLSYYRTGQFNKSVRSFGQAIKLTKELKSRRFESLLLVDKALALSAIKKHVEAEKCIQQAIKLMEGREPADPEQRADFFWARFKVFTAVGKDREATQSLKKAYEAIMEQAQAIRDSDFKGSFLNRIPKNQEIIEAWGRFGA